MAGSFPTGLAEVLHGWHGGQGCQWLVAAPTQGENPVLYGSGCSRLWKYNVCDVPLSQLLVSLGLVFSRCPHL